MPITFNVQIDDPKRFLNDHSSIAANIQVAGKLWADHINSDAAIKIDVKPSLTKEDGRAAARSWSNVRYGFDDHWHCCLVRDSVPDAIIKGEQYTPDACILVELSPKYMHEEIWLDPDPWSRSEKVPADRKDGVSLFLHELAHGLGINGFLDCKTGKPKEQKEKIVSTYDQHVRFDGEFWFCGDAAKSVYGDKVPLTRGTQNNTYHHVKCADDLMNGIGFPNGHRYYISLLDLAILKDIGLPIILHKGH